MLIRTTIQIANIFKKSSAGTNRNACVLKNLFSQYYCEQPLHALRFVSSSANSTIQNSEQSPIDANNNKIKETSEWKEIYRFRYIRHLHVVSRIKLYQTVLLFGGTPIAYYLSDWDNSVAVQLASLSLFALGVLGAFSYYSTKLVGVINMNEKNNEIQIGHLTFYGRRQNTNLTLDDLTPPSSLGESANKDILIAFNQISTSKRFYMCLKYGLIYDHEQFFKVFGPVY